jgi:phosphonoacetaldehyde hydrolase
MGGDDKVKINAVVFDWAGTIVDFGSLAPMGAFVQLFERHGVPVTIAQARVPMGLPKIDHIRAMGRMPEIAQAWRVAHAGRDFSEDDAQSLLQEFEPMSAESAWDCRAFIPGFLETYAWLQSQGIRVATTTGYTRRIMAPIIAHAAEQGFVPDAVICCDDVLRSRPDPMGMLACCTAMGLAPGLQILKVDDTAPGIEEGLNAGCLTLGVAASGNALGWSLPQWEASSAGEREAALGVARAQLEAAGAHGVINSVADLPHAVETIAERLRLGGTAV